MAGLPTDFVNAIEAIKAPRLLNTVSEPDKNIPSETINAKFFLPSLEQMYITPQVAGVEGDYWEYYKTLASAAGLPGKFAHNTSYSQLLSYALDNPSIAQVARLGSIHTNSYQAWAIDSNGKIIGSVVNSPYRCRPACFI